MASSYDRLREGRAKRTSTPTPRRRSARTSRTDADVDEVVLGVATGSDRTKTHSEHEQPRGHVERVEHREAVEDRRRRCPLVVGAGRRPERAPDLATAGRGRRAPSSERSPRPHAGQGAPSAARRARRPAREGEARTPEDHQRVQRRQRAPAAAGTPGGGQVTGSARGRSRTRRTGRRTSSPTTPRKITIPSEEVNSSLGRGRSVGDRCPSVSRRRRDRRRPRASSAHARGAPRSASSQSRPSSLLHLGVGVLVRAADAPSGSTSKLWCGGRRRASPTRACRPATGSPRPSSRRTRCGRSCTTKTSWLRPSSERREAACSSLSGCRCWRNVYWYGS